MFVAILCVALLVRASHAAYIDLLRQAASRYAVPNSLMLSIAYVESKGVLTALNIEGDSVFPQTWEEGQALLQEHAHRNIDVGVMQINVPTWSHRLRLSADILYQPHINLPVAAYVLRRCIDESSGDLWKGVGCYHSQRFRNQKTYVGRVWRTYTTLRRRGIFGPTLTRTEGDDTDPNTQIIPREASPGVQQPLLLPAGRYSTITIPRADWRPPQSGLPHCPTPQPQVRTVVGKERVTLVFFTPGQAWPELGGTERELVLGMCVDCQLADLAPLSEAVGQPVHIAALGVLQQLNVSCLPTVVRLTPQATPTHRESEP
jgi:hypothetical protein